MSDTQLDLIMFVSSVAMSQSSSLVGIVKTGRAAALYLKL